MGGDVVRLFKYLARAWRRFKCRNHREVGYQPKPPNLEIIITNPFDGDIGEGMAEAIARAMRDGIVPSRPWGRLSFSDKYFCGCMGSPGRRARATPMDAEYY